MITWDYLPWQAWKYLAGISSAMDAAEALAHAKACALCQYELAAICASAAPVTAPRRATRPLAVAGVRRGPRHRVRKAGR